MSTEQSELAIQTWELCLPLCQMARARIDGGYLVHGTAAEKSAKLSGASPGWAV